MAKFGAKKLMAGSEEMYGGAMGKVMKFKKKKKTSKYMGALATKC